MTLYMSALNISVKADKKADQLRLEKLEQEKMVSYLPSV